MNRRGKFTIPYHLLEDADIMLLRALMKDVIVFHIDNNYATAEITYWAYHPSFERVKHGDIVPTYEYVMLQWRKC